MSDVRSCIILNKAFTSEESTFKLRARGACPALHRELVSEANAPRPSLADNLYEGKPKVRKAEKPR
eukprot:4665068-Pleurochrysis_carterae.AAC.1